ncbi:MAG: AAA family ATPase [Saprospiraceae bacterium]
MKRAIKHHLMLVGREKEINTLQSLLISDESELVSVIGRRRVGKTFLVQSVYAERIAFEITGIQHASLKEQLEHFSIVLSLAAKSNLPLEKPKSWLEAFRMLILYLENTSGADKRVVFFDEMPWLATHRSGFLNAFGFFWNSWAVKNNIVVVICGSAASWMIQKVVHHKGGLYNRITKRIQLQPFSLHETELFLQKKGLKFNRAQIAELYMAFGGIPHYLKEIQQGESVSQNIDRICFESGGILHDEFDQLYPSLFDQSDNHIAVVRALSTTWSGLTRSEIIRISKLTNGGGLTKTIEELMYSGFITEYLPFGRIKREMVYRLTDEYSLFYLKFIETMRKEGAGIWKSFYLSPAYRAWSGYAFESICLKHLPEIKKALGISGIFSSSSAFYHKGTDGMEGCQIDLLIDREDRVINLCEIKWAASEFIISKSYAEALRKKLGLFTYYSKTKKQVFLTFISTYGLLPNEHSTGIVDNNITLNDLFSGV